MSYILEALKKSQAERQLGELPTIHAPQLQTGTPGVAGRALGKPVWLALGAMTALALTLAALMWRGAAPAPQAAPTDAAVAAPAASAPSAAPAPSATPAHSPTVAPMPSAVAAAPAAVPVPDPAPAPASAAAVAAALATAARAPTAVSAPVAAVADSARATPQAAIVEKSARPASPVAPPKPVAVASLPAPAVEPAPPAEDSVAGLRDLPEPIQRQIPTLALGGYIYSKNPADRLLLVDKALRHEGEEVAPGLTLEKLQPKSAIFTFKGYRYRVPY